jgi:hypothetical protein
MKDFLLSAARAAQPFAQSALLAVIAAGIAYGTQWASTETTSPYAPLVSAAMVVAADALRRWQEQQRNPPVAPPASPKQ